MLQRLLGTIPVAHFLNEKTLQIPFTLRGGCSHLRDLVRWETLDELVRAQNNPVELLAAGEDPFSLPAERPSCQATARALMSLGFTVSALVRHPFHDGLAQLAVSLADDFGGQADVIVLGTPAGQRATAWQRDDGDVYSLQLVGSRAWELRPNPDYPCDPDPFMKDDDYPVRPVQRVTLEAGDWLYCPALYLHRCQAIEDSLALTICVYPARRLHVFRALRPRLTKSLRWQQTLHPLEPLSRLRQSCSGLTVNLLEIMTDEEFLRSWHLPEADPNAFVERRDPGVVTPYDACFGLDEQLAGLADWRRHILPVPGAACPVSAGERLRLYRELFTTLWAELNQIMNGDKYFVDYVVNSGWRLSRCTRR